MSRLRLSWIALPLTLLGCSESASQGQSGSENSQPAPEQPGVMEPSVVDHGPVRPASGGVDQQDHPDQAECPCARFEGVAPLAGRVLSWESTVLELEVTDALVDTDDEQSPGVGDSITGIYLGELPCYWGTYLPEPGDEVLAYILPDEDLPTLCCGVAACSQQCEGETENPDGCLAECQVPARDACVSEREALTIIGQLLITPLIDGSAPFALAEDTPYDIALDDLPTIYEGGAQCTEKVSSAQVELDGLRRGQSLPWTESCAQ